MSETELSESIAGDAPPTTDVSELEDEGGASVTEGDVPTTAEEDSEFEAEDATTEGIEGVAAESAPVPLQDAAEPPYAPQIESNNEIEEKSDVMSVLVSEMEDEEGFSEYEQSEGEFYDEDKEEEPATDLPAFSSDVIQILSRQVDIPEIGSTGIFEAVPPPREKTPEKEVKRTYSISESDEELARIPVPVMKTNKIIPKLPEPKYQMWPIKIFEIENLYKIVEAAVPRFFPRNFPYSSKGVTKRCSMLAQYLQKKVYQMGHDRRKLMTVVRYQQKNWNGHKAVIRYLWVMETDALVKYAHEGEGFVVSAVVIGMYMD